MTISSARISFSRTLFMSSGRPRPWSALLSAAMAVRWKLLALLSAGMAAALSLSNSAAWAEEVAVRKPLGFFGVWGLPRIWVGAAFCLIGLVLLVRFWAHGNAGRSLASSASEGKSRSTFRLWTHRNLRLVVLVLTFFVFGVILILPLGNFARGMSIHPSPICIVTKPFLFVHAGRAVPVVFLSILAFVGVFTVVGNKLFCGWVCPIGAAQEIAHRIPLPKRLKIKIPFRASNSIRLLLYVAFLIAIFAAGVSIYDYFNPFEFLFWEFQPLMIVVFLAVLVAAVFIFRAFCYLVCPLGLITWVLEHLSAVKVRVDKQKCTDCNICVEMSPCPAVPSILEDRKSRPDCHACGRCIEVCPEGALAFRR